jgi:two-component system, NtrC family, response regulator AtoC
MAMLGDLAGPAQLEPLRIGAQQVILGDPGMVQLYALVDRLARVDIPVLVTGETGCGKELVAIALHARSRRADKPLIVFNCAGLHPGLLEDALFGRGQDAASGVIAPTAGLLAAASGSTLVLDEVGELTLETQAKLLRVLESRRGSWDSDLRERDVRIVATSNRDLEADVAAGRLYGDLFLRLSVATLEVPPLRHRLAELPLLATAFLEEACRHSGRSIMRISDGALAVLCAYSWPGNIRELKNVMRYVAAALSVDVLLAAHVSEQVGRLRTAWTPVPRSGATGAIAPAGPSTGLPFRPIADELRELEITRIREALEATSGNQTRAASLLAMPIRTFFAKAKQYGLTPRKKRYGD